MSYRCVTLFSVLLTLALVLTPPLVAQSQPLVIAWQAPTDTTTMCGANTCYYNFAKYELPYVSGIGVAFHWSAIDDCSTTTWCTGDGTIGSSCPDGHSGDFQWCLVDNMLLNYITNPWTPFTNKKIVLILYPEDDESNTSGTQQTPQYVFSSTFASSQANSNPQDMIVCKNWSGDISGTTFPVYSTGTLGSNDFAIWSLAGCFATGTHLACSGTPPYSSVDLSGFPIVYEQPILIAYQHFLTNLVLHYTSGNGASIEPYIAYIRAGMAMGGENDPACATAGAIPSASWMASTKFPSGYVLLASDGNVYVATGGGITGTSMPTCSILGCTTSVDGTIPGWYNVGPPPVGHPLLSNAIWPGPRGQFLPGNEAGGYTDNGYLTTWIGSSSDSPADGTGYITLMDNFLHNLLANLAIRLLSHLTYRLTLVRPPTRALRMQIARLSLRRQME
jgi:hypothetical protein